MPHIPNLRRHDTDGRRRAHAEVPRRADASVHARPQGFVDTPNLIYSQWLEQSGGIDAPVASVPAGTTVGIIGGGIAGIVAAFELQKCGATVTLMEASDRIGGRLDSVALGSSDIAEMGAMRFPPSEDLLYYYADALGFSFEDNFPDPGHNDTYISYKGQGMDWKANALPPSAFDTVNKGWHAFIKHGITTDGGKTRVFESAKTIESRLKSPDNADEVTTYFQRYLDEFGTDSFYTGLQKIFGAGHKWDVPGGVPWTAEDFTKFGTLGVGSGGFGPLYPIGFNYIFRLIPNGLETDQAIFPAGIENLAKALAQKFIALGGTVLTDAIARVNSVSDASVQVVHHNASHSKVHSKTFDRVIVATTTRSMEMNQFLTGPTSTAQSEVELLSADTAEAVERLHVISSSKLFVRTKKFWADATYPRNILSDTKVPQVYTLDYGGTEGDQDTGVVLVTYTWQDASTKTLAFSDKVALLAELKRQIARLVEGTHFADYADQIVPIDGDDDIQLINWQSEPFFYGAFTLAQPGQDAYVQQAFYDFMKAGGATDNGVYLATDCISFCGGWIDGALHTSLNAVSAVVKSVGGTFDSTSGPLAPIAVLKADRYSY